MISYHPSCCPQCTPSRICIPLSSACKVWELSFSGEVSLLNEIDWPPWAIEWQNKSHGILAAAACMAFGQDIAAQSVNAMKEAVQDVDMPSTPLLTLLGQ